MIFLFQYNVCTVPDSYRIVTCFVSDMPRGASRAAATSKMEPFVIIINDWKQLTIITKRSTLDVTADLDPPLMPSVHIGMIFALDRG